MQLRHSGAQDEVPHSVAAHGANLLKFVARLYIDDFRVDLVVHVTTQQRAISYRYLYSAMPAQDGNVRISMYLLHVVYILVILQMPAVLSTAIKISASTAADAVQALTSAPLQTIQAAATFINCLTSIPGNPELHLPGSPDYRTYSNGLRIIRWQSPRAVVYAENTSQVQAAVHCATSNSVQPIPRAGGNSFEALSSGNGALVIDITKMSKVIVDVPGMKATVQGGTRMGEEVAALKLVAALYQTAVFNQKRHLQQPCCTCVAALSNSGGIVGRVLLLYCIVHRQRNTHT